MTQLEAHVDRQAAVAGLASSIDAFGQRVQARLTNATFEQRRRLVEWLIDRVIVIDDEVEIRYVIPMHPRSEHVRFCQLRKDYFHHIIEIFHLPDGDRRAVRLVVPPDGTGIGLAPIDGDRLGRAMTADRLGEEAFSRLLVARLREQEINGLAGLIHGAIEIAPLPFDLHVRFIHAPADPHRLLRAEGCNLAPAMDGRVVDRHPAFLHACFHLAVAQPVGQVSPHTREDNILPNVGTLEVHHHRAPSLRTLGHRGSSYPKWHANENLRQNLGVSPGFREAFGRIPMTQPPTSHGANLPTTNASFRRLTTSSTTCCEAPNGS
jgi:hypothetical protein